MSPEQFCYWLQGYAELNKIAPSDAQWKSITEHLQSVFTKVTPPLDESTQQLTYDSASPLCGSNSVNNVYCAKIEHVPMDVKKIPKIVSAATKHKICHREGDSTDIFISPHTELIISSPRHYDAVHRAILAALYYDDSFTGIDELSQGFVDQFGIFYSREEALVVATVAGQLVGRTKTQPESQLFSEDLY